MPRRLGAPGGAAGQGHSSGTRGHVNHALTWCGSGQPGGRAERLRQHRLIPIAAQGLNEQSPPHPREVNVSAILFGSIGTIADSSELQRQAFNDAFAEHGLDWHWDRGSYRMMLGESGGAKRVAAYAEELGVAVDAPAVHATKTARFHELLGSSGLTRRPGVADTIDEARRSGIAVAMVTTTSPENVAAVLDALGPQLSAAAFDLIVDASQVVHPKPAPDAYLHALAALGEDARSCVAIEDNLGGITAASAAGIACAAFPNANTRDHDFEGAIVVERIDMGVLYKAGARDDGEAPA